MGATERDRFTILDALSVMRTGEGSPIGRHRAGGRMVRDYVDGRVTWDFHAREVYSYGRHFPLVRYVPRHVSGRRRDLYVLNGDRWGGPNSRTNEHQFATRAAVEDLAYCADSIVIPFGALTGAGIDIDTVRPIDVRADEWWDETVRVRTLVEVPVSRRRYSVSVERTAETLEGMPEDRRRSYDYGARGWREAEPGADGRYHWTGSEQREIGRDDDGLYSWAEHRHRLGDSLFSAVRDVDEPARPALPFESARDNRRERVTLRDSDGREWCEANETREHESGVEGACVHCGRLLYAHAVWHRRARYLSSFDTNEPGGLYFLCEVPRSAGATVAQAIDSLAPPAVHAALARGREVKRQGDIFLIDTELTREDLLARGARFARLSMWETDSRPRAHEAGYVAPLSAARRRAMARYARRLWRERMQAELERDNRPQTGRGARAAWRTLRERHANELAKANEDHRRALFAGPRRDSWRYGYSTRRTAHATSLVHARERIDRLRARGVRDSHEHTSRAHARDWYRRTGSSALEIWRDAYLDARRRFEPATVEDTFAWEKRRATARRACAIYGTAHSATELAHVGATTYVRGRVRHVPSLVEEWRNEADHIPVPLAQDHWYLAVRNTVPRQARRRRRPTSARVAR